MKSLIAPVKNVKAFAVAGQALLDRSVNTPGIGVAFGRAGDGKSRTVSWWATRTEASYVRAMAAWRTPGPMLQAICLELGIAPRARHAETHKMIAEMLARGERPKPLVFDEADYLVKHPELLDTLRDIHDLSGAPLVLIGMQHFVSKLLSLRDQEQFVSRISQVVEFKPLDREDAGTLLKYIADVEVADDLIDRLHGEANGSARLLVVALEQIESLAKRKGLKRVAHADAKHEKFTLDRRPDLLDRLGLRAAAGVA
ncbi:MAG: AAA family ATPase [Reyranella sp.]|nr:AAA family ATPase [Reyranella sp.]